LPNLRYQISNREFEAPHLKADIIAKLPLAKAQQAEYTDQREQPLMFKF